MRTVSIVGVGKTPFGALSNDGLRSLGAAACRRCLEDAEAEAAQVQAFYLGNFAGDAFVGQNHLAPYIASAVGITGVPATRFEAACASSGSAFFHAWSAVAAGIYDCVMVAGVEKMTSQTTAKVAEILAGAGDLAGEVRAGATFPAMFAMVARRHMHQYGTKREQLAAVAVKNHYNGSLNPEAHLRKVITLEQALAGRMVAEPLTLYDCSLVSDGAAAVLLMADEVAGRYAGRRARVRGVAQTSDYVALEEKADITTFRAVVSAGEQARRMAVVSAADVQLCEVHDCFTIAEVIALEDLGFVAKGQGGAFAASGATGLAGSLPVNPSGGLKSKGHPVGATGVAQLCELVTQLRGEAGARQVPRHELALAQNLGGSGATAVVTILEAA
jgi:acetyl-CoA C-acetyltransferase